MIKNQFVSAKKEDSNFLNLLMGHSHPGLRPIPIQSLNVGMTNEIVTFELVPLDQLRKPNWFIRFAGIIKLKSFILILFPFFFVLAKSGIQIGVSDPVSLFLAIIAVAFIFSGLNIRNDIVDHISGFDRVNISTSPKPILAGWATAYNLNKVSWALMICGLFVSLPVLLLQPLTIAVVIPVSLFILFLIMGLGLVTGLQLASGGVVDFQTLVFGIFWGSLVQFLLHMNNFSHLMTSTQAGIKNSITRLGFDHAKLFLAFWWLGCLTVWGWYHFLFSFGEFWWGSSLVLVFVSILFFIRLLRIASPLGSELRKIQRFSYLLFLMMVAILFIEMIGTSW